MYHNPRCSKSRCALQFLEDQHIDYEIKDYLKQIPSVNELKSILKLLGITAEELIRKGESEYKAHFKGKNLTEDQWVAAMVKFPKLIERPIVVNQNKAVVARPVELIDTLK